MSLSLALPLLPKRRGSFYLPRFRLANRGQSPMVFSPCPFPGCDASGKPPRHKKGTPSLAGHSRGASPFAKTVHRTVFAIHPLRSARSIGFRSLRAATRGYAPLDACGLLKKAGENFFLYMRRCHVAIPCSNAGMIKSCSKNKKFEIFS